MNQQTGLIFFPAFDWSLSATHPEREERLLYTRDQIFEEGILDLPQVVEYKPRLATPKDIARTHICIPDVEAQVTEAHLAAAGAGLVLADALMSGEIKNGFSLVRPPGHHSMRVVHGNRGFCNINNVAVLVDYLRARHKVQRVAIVDTDVHHGDGTQDIFYHDPNVLFISFHQDGRTLYPGTGFPEEMGGPAAYGRTVNIPLPPGTSDEGLHYVLDNLVLPILREFQPDLIINSAGQDNHYSDPLGGMKISAQGYARMAQKLQPDLAVLEGGYAVESALPYVNLGIIMAMAGLDFSGIREPDFDPEALRQDARITNYISQLVDEIGQLWSRQSNKSQEFTLTNGYYQRTKHLFYDTCFIREEQLEKVACCSQCAGLMDLVSAANLNKGRAGKVRALILPFQSCPGCQQAAENLYKQAKKQGGWEHIYLSDRSGDRYLHYDGLAKKAREY
ncbi:MAG: histone deacetylase [Clostridia bacterium]|nr:histone deacetylase [Clostridia bacterium]